MSEQHPTLVTRAMTRRRMLQGTALAGVAAFLAACGTAAQSATPSAAPSEAASTAPSEAPSPSPAASATAKPSPAAELNFANWPLYIDQDSSNPPKSPTLDGFTKKYGCTRLVWFESHATMEPAIRRERLLKHWLRDWKLALIEEVNPEWRDLSDGWFGEFQLQTPTPF